MTEFIELYVPNHARLRARERFPVELARGVAAKITAEVREAFAEGRVSAEKPAGVLNETYPDCLYAWTADAIRIYVLTINRFSGGRDFAVKTVIKSALAEEGGAA